MTAPPLALIVDDHPLVAVALRAALREQGLDARHLDPRDGDALSAALAGADSGLVVLDLDLGTAHSDGAALVPVIRSAGWNAVLLTGSRDRARIAAAVAAGALGWLAKDRPFEEVVAAVVALAAGERVFDPGRRADLVAAHHAAQSARSDLDRRWSRLTPREREILGCLVDGKRVADVAREYVVSPATVRTQVRSILAKLEVGSQLEAVALARRAG
jgi:two-component system, NarL family, nitrate/nitrite response regulator NarL